MTGPNIQAGLRRAVCLLFLAAFACIFLVIGLRGHLDLSVCRLAFCALLAAGAFALRRFLPLVDRLSPGRWRAVFGGGLALLLALQLGSGFLLLQDLTTSPFDTEAVLRTATELAQGTVPALYNDYFASVDTNVFCMFVLYWMYRPVYLLTGATGPAWAMGLNALCLFIAAVCVCGAAGARRRRLCSALSSCLTTSSLLLFTPIPWPHRWWRAACGPFWLWRTAGVIFPEGPGCWAAPVLVFLWGLLF